MAWRNPPGLDFGSYQTRRFDALNGFCDVADGGCEQVDHGDKGAPVAVAAGPCPGGLEDTVEPFQASVGVTRMPTLDDRFELVLDRRQRGAHGIEEGRFTHPLPGQIDKSRQAPAGRLRRNGGAHPS